MLVLLGLLTLPAVPDSVPPPVVAAAVDAKLSPAHVHEPIVYAMMFLACN